MQPQIHSVPFSCRGEQFRRWRQGYVFDFNKGAIDHGQFSASHSTSTQAPPRQTVSAVHSADVVQPGEAMQASSKQTWPTRQSPVRAQGAPHIGTDVAQRSGSSQTSTPQGMSRPSPSPSPSPSPATQDPPSQTSATPQSASALQATAGGGGSHALPRTRVQQAVRRRSNEERRFIQISGKGREKEFRQSQGSRNGIGLGDCSVHVMMPLTPLMLVGTSAVDVAICPCTADAVSAIGTSGPGLPKFSVGCTEPR